MRPSPIGELGTHGAGSTSEIVPTWRASLSEPPNGRNSIPRYNYCEARYQGGPPTRKCCLPGPPAWLRWRLPEQPPYWSTRSAPSPRSVAGLASPATVTNVSDYLANAYDKLWHRSAGVWHRSATP